ncbi:YdcF family protein [bacterium]|nr:YdcF family protein [bacterium]
MKNIDKAKSKKKAYIILGIVFLLISICLYMFFSIGSFLSPQNKLEKSDVIVAISGGETRTRTEEAIKLYKDGWAPYLLFSGAARSGDVSNAESMKNVAIKKGVPAEKIFIEEESTSTYENALLSKKIIDKYKWSKIILVTSPYHQRRALMNFNYVLGKDVKVINHSSDDSYWSAAEWYRGDKNRNTSFEELSRVIYLIFTKNYSLEVK